ncbi:hypothetical protein K030075H31_03910 [Blautia producta]
MYVKKDYLVKLLDQNLYETADEKLQAWRNLRWIITMEGRLTKRRRWTSTNRLEYVIHIPLSVGRRLKFSPETGVNFGENKTKNNIWDVLTGKPAWLIGFPLFCVQIDNDSR